MAKKTITLPKLPRGMGTYSWRDDSHTTIQFRKNIGQGEYKKRHTVYGETVQECNKKMQSDEKDYETECKYKLNSNPRNSSTPIKIALYNWMITYKQPVLKGKSYDTLEGIYKNQFLPADFANKQTEQVTDHDIQTWLNDICEKTSNSTTKKSYTLLKMFLDYYYVKHPYDNPIILVKVPAKQASIELDEKGLPINPNKAYEVLNDAEIDLFIQEASKPLCNGIGGYKHGQFFIFTVWSYMRYGEILALQWKDTDFKNKGAYVYKTYSYIIDRSNDAKRRRKWELTVAKTEKSIRYEYLCDNAINALNEYKKQKKGFTSDDDFIFTTDDGKPISNDQLNRNLKSILKNAGIDKKITIHGLRHTGISYFLRKGIDVSVVSKQAGHASADITQKIYYTITQQQYQSEIDKINKQL